MIDENLCRAELSPADRAAQTARRKAISRLHPETGRGGDRKSIKVASVEFDRPNSFVAETVAATGKSAATVYRDAERGEMVTGTTSAENKDR